MVMTKQIEDTSVTAAVGFTNALLHGYVVGLFMGINNGFNILGTQSYAQSKRKLYVYICFFKYIFNKYEIYICIYINR